MWHLRDLPLASFWEVCDSIAWKNLSFLFRVDETTTLQIQKQFDAYATYDTRHFGQTVTT